MSTIPASAIVNVTPGVLAAGGSALDLNGLLLTTSARAPIGQVLSFASQAAVSDYFGATSDEATRATEYFGGFTNSNAKPGAMLIAQYPLAGAPAWLRGGDLSTMTLSELQALSGQLDVTIDGSAEGASISLAAATSFSDAAQIIQDALGITGVQAASVTGSISGDTMTVTAVASGSIEVGQLVSGTGVAAGTYVTALVSGTGGAGTYTVNNSQTALSQTITATDPAVLYDSVAGAFQIFSGTTGTGSTMGFASGALGVSLLMDSAGGAVRSQGAAAADAGTFMDAVVLVTQNWATFMLGFDPDESGNDIKMEFSAWTSGRNNRYMFVCWDDDLSPSTSYPAASSMGRLIADAEYAGTFLLGRDSADYADLVSIAAFVCGTVASIDFTEAEGRVTLAFRSQDGLVASVTGETAAENLRANGYNFYGAYGTANDDFVFLYNGQVSGEFLWADSYVNQIWLNNAFQLALIELLTNSRSIAYNAAGNALIEAALADPINAALNFGAFRPGVTLSSAQRAAVNAAAGVNVAGTLETRGWYLQVLPASASVRAARGSPPCTFWYMDGQSVQSINLASIEIQ